MLVIDGLKRIINSAKVQTTAAAAFGAWVTYATSDGTPAEKAPLKLALIIAVGTLVGIVLVSWAAEDFAKHRADAPAKPSTQVNVQSDVKNPAPTPQDARPAPVVEPPKPEVTEKQLLLAIYQHLKAQAKQPVPPVVVQTPPAPHETSA
jgi:hypothetical protein